MLTESLSADTRAEQLLGEMTLEEKCHQLTGVAAWALIDPDGSDSPQAEETLRTPPGVVSNFATDDPAQLARLVGSMQRQAVTRTRLGIPLLVHIEALN